MIKNEEKYMQALKDAAAKHRKSFIALGILSLILGIVGLFMSVAVTLASTVIFGVFTVIAGILFFVEAFAQDGFGSKLLMSLVSVMYIIGGAVMTIHPTISAVWITLFMAFFFIFIGIVRIVSGLMMRQESPAWFAIVINGVLGLLLGVLMYSGWPASGLWVIGMFVSIELIMQGVTVIAIANGVKRLAQNIGV